MPGVGDAWIEVHADGSSLYREVREAAERAARGAKIVLKTSVDTKGLSAQVKAAAARASRGAKIVFKTDLDTKGLSAKVRAAAKAAGATVRVKARVDQETLRVGRLVDRDKAKVSVTVDEAALAASLARARAAFVRDDIKVKVEADTTLAEAEIAAVKASLDNETVRVHLKADPDLASARISVDLLRARLESNPITIPVRVDTSLLSQVKTALSGLNLGRLLTPLSNIGGAIGTVFKFTVAQAALLVTAVGIALPYIEALGVALAGLVVDLGTAALSGGGFVVSGIAAIGVAAATTAVGVTGMSNAFKSLNKIWAAQARGSAASAKDIKAFQESLSTLAPSAQAFVLSVDRIQPAWTRLTRGVQESLFAGVGDQLERTARVVLPHLEAGLSGVAGVLNQAVQSFLIWTQTAEGVRTIDSVFAQVKTTLTDMSTIAGNAGKGLLNLFVGGEANARGLGDAFVTLSQRFEDWTSRITQPGAGGMSVFDQVLSNGLDNLKKIGGVLSSTGSLISSFWSNWNAGGQRPDILSDLQGQLEEWAAWFRDPANEGAVRDFIARTAADFDSLKSAAVNVAGAINTVSDAFRELTHPQNIQPGTELKDIWGNIIPGTGFDPNADTLMNKIRRALGLLDDLPSVDAKVDVNVVPNVTFSPSNVPNRLPGQQVEQVRANVQRALRARALKDIKIQLRGEISIGWVAPPDAKVQQEALKAIARGKKTFTLDGAKYKITAKGEIELVTHPPTQAELLKAALKAGAKGGDTFKLKGKKYKITAEGTIVPLITPPKMTDLEKSVAGAVKAFNAFRPKGKKVTWQIDPSVKLGKLSDDEKAKINKAIIDALASGKAGKVTIDGKQFTVDVNGNLVTIEPYKGPKPEVKTTGNMDTVKPPKKPVKVPAEVILGQIPIPQEPTPLPVKPVIPDPLPGGNLVVPVEPKVKLPGEWGRGIPLTASLTLNPGSTRQVLQQAQQDVNDGVHIPSEYDPLPTFPTLPKPRVTVGTGYAGLPAFPKLPKPKVTIGIGYGPLPAFPALPSPTVHVKVVYDGPVDAAGTVAGSMGGFAPNNPPRRMAGVRITHGPEFALIGERGPEAVVPLSRTGPLDPEVRALLQSVAAARGLSGSDEPAVVQNIMLPTGDPLAAAMAVANRLALVRTV